MSPINNSCEAQASEPSGWVGGWVDRGGAKGPSGPTACWESNGRIAGRHGLCEAHASESLATASCWNSHRGRRPLWCLSWGRERGGGRASRVFQDLSSSPLRCFGNDWHHMYIKWAFAHRRTCRVDRTRPDRIIASLMLVMTNRRQAGARRDSCILCLPRAR